MRMPELWSADFRSTRRRILADLVLKTKSPSCFAGGAGSPETGLEFVDEVRGDGDSVAVFVGAVIIVVAAEVAVPADFSAGHDVRPERVVGREGEGAQLVVVRRGRGVPGRVGSFGVLGTCIQFQLLGRGEGSVERGGPGVILLRPKSAAQ